MIDEKIQEQFTRARNAFRLRDYETADEIVEKLLEAYPRSIAGHNLKGIIAGRMGKHELAIRWYRQTLELEPDNAEALNNVAVSLRQIGELDKALEAAARAEARLGLRADVLYNKGNILKNMGRIDEAIAAYRRALELDENYVLAYNNLGTLYHDRGETKHAIEMLNRGLAVDPNHPTLRYNLGLAYEALNDLESAEESYERSLKSRPGWGEALNNLGIVFQKKQDYRRADRTFREILAMDRNNPRANNNLATNFALQGKTREAMQYYRTALQVDPSYSRAAGNLGQLLDDDSTASNALEEIQQLAQLDTDNIDLQLRLIRGLVHGKRYEAAERVVREVLSRDKTNADATRYFANILLATDRAQQAEQAYKRFHHIAPDDARYLIDRARILRDLDQLDRALTDVRRYLEQEPGDLDALLLQAEILTAQGNSADALTILEELRTLYPGNGKVLAGIANAHKEGGDRDEAIRAVDELINLQGSRADPEDLDALNHSLELYEQAVDAFSEDQQRLWDENLRRLGELSAPEEEEHQPELEIEEVVALDEDSIPILDFGGQELFEPEEWDVHVSDDDAEEDEDEYLGVSPPEQLAPSLVSLPDQEQLRSSEPSFSSIGGGGLSGGAGSSGSAGSSTGGGASASDGEFVASTPPPRPPDASSQHLPPGGAPPGGGSGGGGSGGGAPAGGHASADAAQQSWGRPQPAQYATQAPPAQPSFPMQAPPQQLRPMSPQMQPQPQPQPQPQQPPMAAGPSDFVLEPELEDAPVPGGSSSANASADNAGGFFGEGGDSIESDDDEHEAEDESSGDELVPSPDDFELIEEDFEPEDEKTKDEDETEESLDEEVPTLEDLLGPEVDLDQAGEYDQVVRREPEKLDTQKPVRQPTPRVQPQKSRGASGPAGLLDYLATMTQSLPPDKRAAFENSDVHLKLEYLRARLAGRAGLHRDAGKYIRVQKDSNGTPITPGRLRDTLQYIGQITRYHPDPAIANVLQDRVSRVVQHLESAKEGSE
ncbi:MAG: tetratricopeptide repeat protein [Spirochaetales bacterium]